jgi:uncharacterized protein
MRLTVSDIPESGIEHELRFQIDLTDGAPAQEVLVLIKASRFGDRVLLEGRVTSSSSVKCSRCLKDFTYPVNTDFNAEYVPFSPAEGEHELTAGELDKGFYRDDEIDLSSLVKEHVLLSIPMKPLCDPECRGLCSQCGNNLNESSCDCSRDTIDPRLEPLKKSKSRLT